jgi:hypothetical protein
MGCFIAHGGFGKTGTDSRAQARGYPFSFVIYKRSTVMIETGLLVFLGLLGLAIKLPPAIGMRLLAFPLTLDLSITGAVYALHLGTFSGLMAAAVAGVAASFTISLLRRIFGYVYQDRYYPGLIYLKPERLVWKKSAWIQNLSNLWGLRL